MTTVFETLGVPVPTAEQAHGMGEIGIKHIMKQDYTRSDEVLDMINLFGFEPTNENKQLVAAAIALGASIGDLTSKIKSILKE